jgi:hypothetical protein
MPVHPTFHFHLRRKSLSPNETEEGVPFECDFENLVERLAALPGMFIELDGSFVFRSQGAKTESDSGPWQMDGMIYDSSVPEGNGGLVSRVIWSAIRGQFPQQVWEQVLVCFETPVNELVAVQLEQGARLPISELFT